MPAQEVVSHWAGILAECRRQHHGGFKQFLATNLPAQFTARPMGQAARRHSQESRQELDAKHLGEAIPFELRDWRFQEREI